MEERQVDGLARRLSGGTSRRTTVKGVLAWAAATTATVVTSRRAGAAAARSCPEGRARCGNFCYNPLAFPAAQCCTGFGKPRLCSVTVSCQDCSAA